MKEFYSKDIFLKNKIAQDIYYNVKDLPIIDYHCHLDQKMILNNDGFDDIGSLWLKGDHYKWRAMRLVNINERFITGNASFKEKFMKYAEIMPKLAGNPLYYWTHFELNKIFDINEPLNKNTAENIYNKANIKLKNINVSSLFDLYNVEYVATTNDPTDDLTGYGQCGKVLMTPTFRPDKLFTFDDVYISFLAKATCINIVSLDDLLNAIKNRLDYFVKYGCKISDHGFERFPKTIADYDSARILFQRRDTLTDDERDALFGFLLVWLSKEYSKRKIIMQIHFAVIRNNNKQMFDCCGADSGFDLIGESQNINDMINFFNHQNDEQRPITVLYTLNDVNLSVITAVCGAFRNVRMGAAWWFNDTVKGIIKNLSIISEYSVLGTNLGMLTDSRSFSSYGRFDFFRRILSNFIGELVDNGEYDKNTAIQLAQDICYNNIKELLAL